MGANVEITEKVVELKGGKSSAQFQIPTMNPIRKKRGGKYIFFKYVSSKRF